MLWCARACACARIRTKAKLTSFLVHGVFLFLFLLLLHFSSSSSPSSSFSSSFFFSKGCGDKETRGRRGGRQEEGGEEAQPQAAVIASIPSIIDIQHVIHCYVHTMPNKHLLFVALQHPPLSPDQRPLIDQNLIIISIMKKKKEEEEEEEEKEKERRKKKRKKEKDERIMRTRKTRRSMMCSPFTKKNTLLCLSLSLSLSLSLLLLLLLFSFFFFLLFFSYVLLMNHINQSTPMLKTADNMHDHIYIFIHSLLWKQTNKKRKKKAASYTPGPDSASTNSSRMVGHDAMGS